MTEAARPIDGLRERILEDPELILEDRDLMRALIAANERALGNNIVDLRGIAMERLEQRLNRLEETHRSVIAAAYENISGTNQIHRAVLTLLDPVTFPEFLENLRGPLLEVLRVTRMRLVLETRDPQGTVPGGFEDVLMLVPAGELDAFLGPLSGHGAQGRTVVLRQPAKANEALYGEAAEWIRSEALIRLDFGPGRLDGLLALGSEDPHQFRPNQGTDLLAFFGGAFERAMRRWLA